MACDLKQIKKDSINEAMKNFIGNSTSFKKVSNNKIFLPLSKTFTKTIQYELVKSNIKRLEKWANDKFGDKFTKGWVSSKFYTNGTEVVFNFPGNLEAAYQSKIDGTPIKSSFEEVKDLGDNVFEAEGDIFPTNEDAETALGKEIPYQDNSYQLFSENELPEFKSTIDETEESIAAFAKLPEILKYNDTNENATKAHIEAVILKYNRIHKLDKNNIPKYLNNLQVQLELKMISQDLRTVKADVESRKIIEDKARKSKTYSAIVNNNERLKKHKGTFKPLLKELSNLIVENESTIKQVDNNLKEAIKLRSKETEKAKIDKLNDKITELSRRKQKLIDLNKTPQDIFDSLVSLTNIEPGIVVARDAMVKIKDILLKTLSGPIDIDELGVAHYLLDYWEDFVTDERDMYSGLDVKMNEFTKELIDSKVILDNGRYVILDEPSIKAEGLTSVINSLKILRDNALEDLLVQTSNKINGPITKDTILKQVTDISLVSHLVLDLSTSDRLIDQTLSFALNESNARASLEVQEKTNKLESLVDNLLKRYTFKQLRDLMFRKTKSGKNTRDLTNRFNQEYWDDNFRKKEEIEQKILATEQSTYLSLDEKRDRVRGLRKSYRDYKNSKEVHLDIDLLFGDRFKDIDYLSGKLGTYTQKERDDHIAELKKHLGEDWYNELVEKQNRYLDEWFTVRELTLDTITTSIGGTDALTLKEAQINYTNITEKDGVYYGIHKKDFANFEIDDVKTNPLLYSRFLNTNEEFQYKDINSYITDRYLITTAKKYNLDGSETGLYDKNYETIQNDPQLKQVHDLFYKENKEYVNRLPWNIRKTVRENETTGIMKTFFESIAETRINGKVIHTSNFLTEFLKNRKGFFDGVAKRFRAYGVNEGLGEKSAIIKLQSEFDVANKNEVDKIFFLELEQERLELLSQGLTTDEANNELKKRSKDIRESIIHNMISAETDDFTVSLRNIMLANAELKHKTEILPLIRMYEQGLNLKTLDKNRSNIVETNKAGKKTKNTITSNKKADIYKTEIKSWLGEQVEKYLLRTSEVKASLYPNGEILNRIYRTSQEQNEIKTLRKLYAKQEKALAEGKITQKDFDIAKVKILAELDSLTINVVNPLEGLLKQLGVLSVAQSLFWGVLGPLGNRLGGILVNLFKSTENRSYSPTSYKKALMLLGKSTQTLGSLGWALGGVSGAALGSVLGAPLVVSILGLTLGYKLGESVGTALMKKDPAIQKLTNIMAALDIFKWGDPLISTRSIEARFNKKIDFLKPMTNLQNTEFVNASEQVAAYLYEMHPKIILNGQEVQLKDGFSLFNADGTIAEFIEQNGTLFSIDGYENPITQDGTFLTKDELISFLAKTPYIIATTTGQYDKNRTTQISRYIPGQVASMFKKWAYNEYWRWFEMDTKRHYGVPDLRNKKPYTDFKGRFATLSDQYGKLGALGIMSLYGLGGGIIGLAGVPHATALTVAVGGAAAIYSYNEKRKFDQKNGIQTPYFAEGFNLLAATPLGYIHEMKANSNQKIKKYYDNLTVEDRANINFVRAQTTAILVAFLLVKMLEYSISGEDDDDEYLTAFIRMSRYILDQSSQNATGVMNPNNLIRDVKNFGGSSTASNTIVSNYEMLSAFYHQLEYILNPTDENREKTIYPRKGADFKKGDNQLKVKILRAFPGLNKINQIYKSQGKKPNENK